MLTNNKLVFKDSDSKTKKQVIKKLASVAFENGVVTNAQELEDAFNSRELEFSTGIGEEIAIPHAEISGIKEAAVLVARVKDIEWKSIDNKPVKTVVAIVVPKGGRGEHLEILSTLSKQMMKDDFMKIIKSGSALKVVEAINNVKSSDADNAESTSGGDKYVIGITACPSGVAHTFMAQQKIIDAAKAAGYSYKVETQGSDGQKNALTVSDIKKADAIIISSGIALEGMERFSGYEAKIYESTLQFTIRNADKVLQNALKVTEEFNKAGGPKMGMGAGAFSPSSVEELEGQQSWFKVQISHLMTGLGAMIPLLITAGIFMAIGSLGSLPFIPHDGSADVYNSDWVFGHGAWEGISQGIWIKFCFYFANLGGFLMGFMYPIMAMYIAYSIGGKQALVPAFLGGLLSAGLFQKWGIDGLMYQESFLAFFYPNGFIASSIFGGIIIGFFSGYFVKFLNERIQLGFNLLSIKTLLIVPVISSAAVVIIMMFLVSPAFGMVNYGIQELFVYLGDGGKYIYGWSMAAATATDLGGPINKAAGSVALPMTTSALDVFKEAFASGGTDAAREAAVSMIRTFNQTSRNISIVVPSMGLGLAALTANKLTGRSLFTKDEANIGTQSIFLAFCGISEGAIPFLIKFPVYVLIADISGAIIGSTIAMLFNVIQTFPMSECWGWPLIGSTTVSATSLGYAIPSIGVQMVGYVSGVAIGAITTALIITAFLLKDDLKNDKATKVYSHKQIADLSGTEETEAINKSKESIEEMISYLQEQAKEIEAKVTSSKSSLTSEEIQNQKLSISKLKVKLNKELSVIAKNSFKVQMLNMNLMNDSSTLNDLENQNKNSSKMKAKIAKHEAGIAESTKIIESERVRVGSWISSEISDLKAYSDSLK